MSETALLQLMLANGLGSRTMSKILDRLNSTGVSIDDALQGSTNDIAQQLNLKEVIAENVVSSKTEAEQLSDALFQQNINIVSKWSQDYPRMLRDRLQELAPPILFLGGNLQILKEQSVGFCGSRSASEKGCDIARTFAGKLATEGLNVVSGYANGIDLASHEGAMTSGGTTTIVLAHGILKFSVKQAVAEFIDERNTIIVSEFPPHLPWIARNAMVRNNTICGLSNAMILVESGLSGGTFEAGKSAMRIGCPLFVVEYENPPESAEGNKYFLDKGVKPLHGNSNSSPNLQDLISVIENSEMGPQQKSLFD